ncbi:MAG: DUF4834 family protein [Paenibacillus sp.]|nr:DUF4834 family protein [Paenibacillus sp.]
MATLLGTIIFVYVMWLVVKPLVARYMKRKFQQKVNDMFRQAMGGDPFAQGAYGGQQGSGAQRQQEYEARRERKRKIFGRDEGEYIEFEEIHVTADYTSQSADNGNPRNKRAYTPREPQISDAEWEEI